ncbi:hypothetical protein CTM97_21190 [Photobacterium phosphoreum]|uniref:DUF6602 domain-containing protein n=1 Tax=Photobacterium phosphoreum TaxID=659 RepID=A0A2T3JAQ1_PHOPO|nr:DUF6602 domain-containing protein [Photobacterium phosphoreum]PSU19256.1 hypothetical protein CTM96_21430 [Photobacterium phosphoreum]PSU36879.1 hypothetical protein CTM97_21190 [Photobacterium phosphoreum]PSU45919.1 hypothetical protein C9J18_21425 [Photobacterium phosphoreum]
MSNQIFQALAKDRIDKLKQAYETSKSVFWDENKGKLIHPGEYGEYREKAVIELIELFIPQNLKISEGFIITSNGDVSTQCDIIVYDPNSCPKLTDSAHQRFFPVECVVAVGEVKSDIRTKSECSKILDKLARIKKLKEDVSEPCPYRSYKNRPFTPEMTPFDHIYTFVLCKSLPNMPEKGYEYHSDIKCRHMHNVLVGIDNGHACYTNNGKLGNYYYPQTAKEKHPQVWKALENNDKELPSNFGILLTTLFNHCQVATLLELDIVRYCTNNFADEP